MRYELHADFEEEQELLDRGIPSWSVGKLDVSKNRQNKDNSMGKPDFEVVCSSCGAVVGSMHSNAGEPLCLICHARLLNEYLHDLRKRSDEKAVTPRVASE